MAAAVEWDLQLGLLRVLSHSSCGWCGSTCPMIGHPNTPRSTAGSPHDCAASARHDVAPAAQHLPACSVQHLRQRGRARGAPLRRCLGSWAPAGVGWPSERGAPRARPTARAARGTRCLPPAPPRLLGSAGCTAAPPAPGGRGPRGAGCWREGVGRMQAGLVCLLWRACMRACACVRAHACLRMHVCGGVFGWWRGACESGGGVGRACGPVPGGGEAFRWEEWACGFRQDMPPTCLHTSSLPAPWAQPRGCGRRPGPCSSCAAPCSPGRGKGGGGAKAGGRGFMRKGVVGGRLGEGVGAGQVRRRHASCPCGAA